MDWQVTATTILCKAVEDEVTIIVKGDWSVKCTGLVKYSSRRANLELLQRSFAVKRGLQCQGINCSSIADYVQKLKSEEDLKAGRAGVKK